jgi:NAD(P)-dependent dehydrogenase (short-subunit alcohol dehydrogenase family)
VSEIERVSSANDAAVLAPQLDFGLLGKAAVITGGSRGIGLAIAGRLLDAGANVMLVSRRQAGLAAAAEVLTGRGVGQIATFAANVGDSESAVECIRMTLKSFGSVDVLINNAATNPYIGPTINVDAARWDKTMAVNLRGPLTWTQAAWRGWMCDAGGTVVNVASIGGIRNSSMIGVYNVTKAALIHLTKTLAAELAPAVRVNALAPGLVTTDFARDLWETGGDRVAAALPMKRLGTTADIASAALYLSSDLSRWVTGHTLVIDGGALVATSERG